MTHLLANVGDTLLNTTSSQPLLRVHATTRQDGSMGVMLVNDDPQLTVPATVTINNGPTLARTGILYQFGSGNFISTNSYPRNPVITNNASGLGNSFTISVPPYTLVDVIIPQATRLSTWANWPPLSPAPPIPAARP
jgi:hypothetical protein